MKFTTSLSIFLGASAAVNAARPASEVFNRINKRQPVIEKASSEPFKHPRLQKRASPFLNNATQKFVVNGSAIPDVPFDIGESYAGLLPISSAANETRELFFWFFPSSNPNATNEIAAWFNGGPGCSSLSGLLTENGPFTWEAGTLAPVQNSYSWTNLTNMVWIEQPVGVGYTQGVPDISNEVELGLQLAGFWKNFVTAFGMENFDMYLTGESYAGYYVPYIADAFINANDTTYWNLKGIAINDPIIGDGTNQQDTILIPYIDYWENLFFLNDTFKEQIHAKDAECGYAAYREKYLTFPPPQVSFPVLPDPYASPNYTCDLLDDIYSAALEVNPCFNIYHITDTCPHLYSQLGIVNTGDYSPPGAQVYFNRTDVQAAINAPVGTNWMQCTDVNVFGNGGNRGSDQSLGPAQNGVLQHVIETTNNVIIGSGDLDFLLATNGTLLAIQNMTFNGQQGLSCRPYEPFYVPYHPEYNGGSLAGAGVLGSWVEERGLTFYTIQLSGHELPGYAPGAGYRALEKLLGRIGSFSDEVDFTTQTGNFTGTSPIYAASKPQLRINPHQMKGAGRPGYLPGRH